MRVLRLMLRWVGTTTWEYIPSQASPPPPERDTSRGAGERILSDKLPPQTQGLHEFVASSSFAPSKECSTLRHQRGGIGNAAPPQGSVDIPKVILNIPFPNSVSSNSKDQQSTSSARKRLATSTEPPNSRRVRMAPSIVRAKLAQAPPPTPVRLSKRAAAAQAPAS